MMLSIGFIYFSTSELGVALSTWLASFEPVAFIDPHHPHKCYIEGLPTSEIMCWLSDCEA
jgi:hypothetical protein